MKRVVVIGGVAGGMSAAARIRRLDANAEVQVFEQDNDISVANCGMPYYIGGVIGERSQLLVQTPESIHSRYGIDVKTRHRVTAIDRTRKTVTVKDLDRNRELVVPYDKLIMAPGAYPVRPPIPGIDRPNVFILKNLDDMDAIKAAAQGARRAVVVGAGYIGMEVAENLRHSGLIVDVVERLDHVVPALDPEMTRQLLDEARLNKIKVYLGREVTSFDDQGVHLGDGGVIPADFTVMSVGVKPVSHLAKDAGLELTRTGHIKVDEHMRTSDPDIYAVGDAVAVYNKVLDAFVGVPLAGPANRQGRVAADNVCGRETKYSGTQGTSIVKVFGLAAAGTGLNGKQLKAAGIKFHQVYVHPNQHPGYYPGAAPLDIKVTFDDSGMLLGAQVVGKEGVDVAVNSFAQAMRAGQTVFDLEEAELAYCPVWGNAKHPVNMAAFVAANILRGDVEMLEPGENADFWLDVREEEETLTGMLPGAVHIPMGQVMDRLSEIPKDKLVGIYCAAGLRGYIVYRRLKQLGYRVKNLNGGIRTWRWIFNCDSPEAPAGMCPVAPGSDLMAAGLPDYGTAKSVELPGIADAARRDVLTLDVCGLQCPGPLLKVKKVVDGMKAGQEVEVIASDPGFAADIPMWAKRTGNMLVSVDTIDGNYRAVIRKTSGSSMATATVKTTQAQFSDGGLSVSDGPKGKTIILFSNDLDKVRAAFIIANGAASMGAPVTIFFTFWGLNVLRTNAKQRLNKTFMEKMFGFMMPRGTRALKLSKMNMGGAGTVMMKKIMKDKHALSLDDLIASARDNGVRLVACDMSMDVMGIKHEEMIDGVEIAGVGNYLGIADEGNVNLFI